jgi:hypothetical protein
MAGRGGGGGSRGGGSGGVNPQELGAHVGVAVSVLDWSPFTTRRVLELPSETLALPTPLAVHLYQPPYYWPDARVATRVQALAGHLHARIRYGVGLSGVLRLDCDWGGSVPIVAHRMLEVDVVGDRFTDVVPVTHWEDTNYAYSDSLASGDPGQGLVRFDVLFPGAGVAVTSANAPTVVRLSRYNVAGDLGGGSNPDPYLFVGGGIHTGTGLTFKISWGTSFISLAVVGEMQTDGDGIELGLSLVAGTINETLADAETVTVRIDRATPTRLDVSAAIILGDRAPHQPPTYTYARRTIATEQFESFGVPAFGRRVRLHFIYGEEVGTPADAPLGQYFMTFVAPDGQNLGWIDAASSRESVFGEGVWIPPGAADVRFDNRSPDPVRVMPQFVLGL